MINIKPYLIMFVLSVIFSIFGILNIICNFESTGNYGFWIIFSVGYGLLLFINYKTYQNNRRRLLMTGDVRESALSHVSGDNYHTLYTAERKFINKLLKWKELYPNDITIIATNSEDGSILADISNKLIGFSFKKPRVMSQEQKDKARDRMRNWQENRDKLSQN